MGRFNIDADLTPVKIDNLLPGWVKPAGKPAHATYTLLTSRNHPHRGSAHAPVAA